MNTVAYRWYIFDMDGTLMDSSEAIGVGVAHSLSSIGIDGVAVKDVRRWIGRPLLEIYQYYINERKLDYAMDDDRLAKLVEVYREGHDAHFPSGVKIYPGTRERLQQLRRAGSGLAVATTKYEEAAVYVMDGMGMTDAVDTVCGTDPGRPVKPDPYVIQLALNRLGADPRRTLVVGDTKADILAGRAAGCDTAGVTCGFGAKKDLEELEPDYLLDSIIDVP